MKKILFLLFACVCVFISSCSDDRDDDNPRVRFDVPNLTADNSVQFTINTDNAIYLELFVDGEKVAIDWGDNSEMYRGVESDGDIHRRHRFAPGQYRVKIWADELTFLNLSDYMYNSVSDLKMGRCPKLRQLTLNSLADLKSVTLDNCPNLEYLNLGNCESLTSVDLSKCRKLKSIECYTLPKLQTLDVSKNTDLESLTCYNSNLSSLVLGNNSMLRNIDCAGNNLTSLNLNGTPNLTTLIITRNRFTSIDVSMLEQLYYFQCEKNEFVRLDMSRNADLMALNCAGNKLSELKLSESFVLNYLSVHTNQLDAEDLNRIFETLPESSVVPRMSPISPPLLTNKIAFYNNPGSETCDSTIVTDKYWVIVESAPAGS